MLPKVDGDNRPVQLSPGDVADLRRGRTEVNSQPHRWKAGRRQVQPRRAWWVQSSPSPHRPILFHLSLDVQEAAGPGAPDGGDDGERGPRRGRPRVLWESRP